MKKIFVSVGILVLLATFIGSMSINILTPKNDVYKEGIYRFNDNIKENNLYEMSYKFLKGSSSSSIIILDEKGDTIYKNSSCVGECKVSEIKNGYIVILIGDEVALYFNKLN